MYIDKQNQVLADPTASAWLKSALRALESRDPVDALNDVEALQEIAEQRLNEAFSGFSFKNKWRIAGALDA